MRKLRLVGALVALLLAAAALLSITGGQNVSATATFEAATIVCTDDGAGSHEVVSGSSAGGAPVPTVGAVCAAEIKEQLDAGLGLKRATTPGSTDDGSVYTFFGRA